MGNFIKSIVFGLGHRSIFASWLANIGALAINAVRFLPSHYGDEQLNYVFKKDVIGTNPGHANINDPALNFFARVLLEHRYDYVIEIGAYSMERSARLAKLFPNVRFFALDIGPDYIAERTIDGVTLLSNTPDNIRRLAKKRTERGIVLAHGVLAYYNAPHLREFINLASAFSLDIALVEPNAIGESSRKTSMRRSRISWHHPYLHILGEHGFTMPDENGHQIGTSFSEFSEWYTYVFATKWLS